VTRRRLARGFWIGAAAILVAAALVALVAVLRGEFSDNDGRTLGTLAAAFLAGATLAAGLALLERGARVLGWLAVAVAVPGFALIAYAIWDFVIDGQEDQWRWGWLGILALIATLVAVTARLLARGQPFVRLAWAVGVLGAAAASSSFAAVWRSSMGDALGRVIAALWILTGLGYLLIPVLQRFLAVRKAPDEVRVLAELDGVELVATRAREGLTVALEPGERLVLRRHS
jgi:hypothetical protein